MVENETEKEPVYIGALLKEHREKQNASINEVANQLHLDNRIIQAIENDDHDSLPDPIYVRGYIRSYCKLLNVDADEMLQIYRENVHRGDPEIIPEIKYPTQSSSSDKPVKAFTYLISLGLVLLVIAWWQSNFIVNDTSPSVPQGQVTDEVQQPVQVVEPTIEMADENNLEVPPPETSYTTLVPIEIRSLPGNANDQEANVYDDATISENFDIEVDTQEPTTDSTFIGITLDQDISGIETSTGAADESEFDLTDTQEEEDPPSTGPDTLILTLTADSWIEIFDVNEQKVFFDLGRTGDQLTLYGTAPFDILLGFAQGVNIEYNGTPVDQAPFTRAGVARFTLGE